MENILKLSSIIHNVVVSTALIVGAIWAYVTYVHTNPEFMDLRDHFGVWSSENLNLEMKYTELSAELRTYEFLINVENLNRNNQILINYSDTNLRYRAAGDLIEKYTEVGYERIDGEVEGFYLASNRDRELSYNVTFPKSGVFIVEFDACREPHSDCLVSRFLHVE